jgi:phage tail sheath protein FI
MAIFTPSESPAVTFSEVDLTGVVPNVQSSTGAMVGNFRWGPVEIATKISQEAELASTFGSPDSSNTVDFHSVAQFLRYSADAYVVREITAVAKNAYSSAEGASAPTVKNVDNFDNQVTALDSDSHTFISRWPGDLGNSLKVSMCPYSFGDSSFDTWTYLSSFDAAPTTSTYATGRGASNDELHVVVVDEDGLFSGTRGAILESFPFTSAASDAKTPDGTSNYVKDVINARSQYIWMAGFDSDYSVVGAGTSANASDNFALLAAAVKTVSLSAGVNSATLTPSEVATGFDLFEDVDTIQVDFLIAPQMSARVDTTTVVNDLVSIAGSTRRDCIAIASPARTDVISAVPATAVTNSVTTSNTFTNSSYLVMDNAFLKVYDKYNDQYIFVPAASSTAGIMAATDQQAAPWYSPAGARRGLYLGITALAYSPTKSQRDTLYKAGINPVANIPGQGILLYGDKTKLARPSAFDRINVRRLFLTVERAVSKAAQDVMFEFNDEFTRAGFVNIVEPFLREIKGRRGITDFRVVCDETNNTSAVIDRNEFLAHIFIKPARSINYVTLKFVATRTGASFEEVVGTV